MTETKYEPFSKTAHSCPHQCISRTIYRLNCGARRVHTPSVRVREPRLQDRCRAVAAPIWRFRASSRLRAESSLSDPARRGGGWGARKGVLRQFFERLPKDREYQKKTGE